MLHYLVSVSPFSTETSNSLSTEKINVFSTTLRELNLTDVHRLPAPQSQMLSALEQENPHTPQTGLYVSDFLRGFLTAVCWETNGYCFPTTPMAGSGTWLPCGMTPHPWLHPEVTPNLVLFAEAYIKTTASQLTSMCYPMGLPLDPPPPPLVLHNTEALACGTHKVTVGLIKSGICF